MSFSGALDHGVHCISHLPLVRFVSLFYHFLADFYIFIVLIFSLVLDHGVRCMSHLPLVRLAFLFHYFGQILTFLLSLFSVGFGPRGFLYLSPSTGLIEVFVLPFLADFNVFIVVIFVGLWSLCLSPFTG